MIHDVDEAGFEQAVLARSKEVPVVVDFWAEWCGPCRQLGPALEAEAGARGDSVDLAKIDVDSNQSLAAQFGVQGIPAVKAFRDGKVVAEFTGAIPPAKVAEFFNGLVPSEADLLEASDDETDLRRALELDPRKTGAAAKLAKILIGSDRADEAATLLEAHESDFLAAGLLARIELGEEGGLGTAFGHWDAGDHAAALELLQDEVPGADTDRRNLLRAVMVAMFTELGPESELAREHRRRLAQSL